MTRPALPDADMAVYRATAAERRRRRHRARLERQRRALEVARDGAELLRTSFGARRVAVFGSLVASPQTFDGHSDVDLAVWGLDEAVFFRAVAQLLALEPGMDVDLVRYEDASPSLRDRIEREAQQL